MLFLIFFAAIFSVIPNVHAAYLGLGSKLGRPDVNSHQIELDYDASSNTLTATGFPQGLLTPIDYSTGDDQRDTLTIYSSGFETFSITALYDNVSKTFTSGTLMIQGWVYPHLDNGWPTWPDQIAYDGVLLTGNLTKFGYNPSTSNGSPLEFLFDVTGGLLSEFYLAGQPAGVLLSGYSIDSGTFDGDFTTDFHAVNGLSDTAPASIPIPASFFLMISGGLGLLAYRKMSRKSI
ncbi:MAG: hypothetical protein JRJ85_09155 [Deltaproteobacteria bacterium]|nr:hypothetical protein [Deltaproteobacteria bacterium]